MAIPSGYTAPVRPVKRMPAQVQMNPSAPSNTMDGENTPDDDGSSDGYGEKSDPMDDGEFQALIRSALEIATSYDETQIQPDRLKARRFYLGDMSDDLPARDDGSKVVSYDVRDTIQALLPSMIRIFCSGDAICEFIPVRPEDAAGAKQATDYVNYLIQSRLGVKAVVDIITDAAMSKIGAVKWWWDESVRVEESEFSGLTPADMGMVLTPSSDDEKITLLSYHSEPVTPAEIVPNELNPQPELTQGMQLTDCRIRRVTTEKKLRIEAIPPEERRIDPKARSLTTARFWAHVTTKTHGELIDMGYDEEFIEAHSSGNEDDVSNTQERALRQPSQIDPAREDLPSKDMMDIFYAEIWIRCDRDGDGHQELVKACCIGNAYAVAHEEVVDQFQCAEFQTITQPHIATGRALADDVIDIQICKTGLIRNVMESLPHSIYPRLAIVEDGVNMDDVLSTVPGQPIRMDSIGNVQAIITEFVGQPALDTIAYFDGVKERRTGISDSASGLDADALQSTAQVAANAIVSASQAQIEMIARMIAETGFKPLFAGLLREVVKNQNQPDQIELNGTWVTLDPRPWNADMEVRVHTGLGRGDDQTKMQALTFILSKQEAAIQQGGPSNPVVSLSQYVATLAKVMKLAGYTNISEFMNPNPQIPPPQPPQPPVELQIAQLRNQTVQGAKQASSQLDIWKWEAEVFFKCLDAAAKNGIVPPDAQTVINAIRGGQIQMLPNEQNVHPYPVAPPTPALSPVHAPPGFNVPLPHVAGVGGGMSLPPGM